MSIRLNRRFVFWISFFETTALSMVTFYLVYNWYPDNYFKLFGMDYKLLWFLVVLFILGPIINVFFYKADGESYANDLSLVFVVKLITLSLGLHLGYSQRPILVVFAVERFVVVQGHQVDVSDVPPGIVKMMLSSEGPPLVAARKLPEDDLGLLLEVMSGGVDIEYRPEQYEKFEFQKEKFYERICRIDYDKNRNKKSCELVSVPLVYDWDRFATAVYDSKSERIHKILPQDPWL